MGIPPTATRHWFSRNAYCFSLSGPNNSHSLTGLTTDKQKQGREGLRTNDHVKKGKKKLQCIVIHNCVHISTPDDGRLSLANQRSCPTEPHHHPVAHREPAATYNPCNLPITSKKLLPFLRSPTCHRESGPSCLAITRPSRAQGTRLIKYTSSCVLTSDLVNSNPRDPPTISSSFTWQEGTIAPPRKLFVCKIRVHTSYAPHRSQVKSKLSGTASTLARDSRDRKLSSVSCACNSCTYCVYRITIGQGTASLLRLGIVKFRVTSFGSLASPQWHEWIMDSRREVDHKKTNPGMFTLRTLLSSANFSLWRCGLPQATLPDIRSPPRGSSRESKTTSGFALSGIWCSAPRCSVAICGYAIEPMIASSDLPLNRLLLSSNPDYSTRFR